MKKARDFDCVQMKTAIQQQLLKEIDELGEDEARKRQLERAMNSPILGPLLRLKLGVPTNEPKQKAS